MKKNMRLAMGFLLFSLVYGCVAEQKANEVVSMIKSSGADDKEVYQKPAQQSIDPRYLSTNKLGDRKSIRETQSKLKGLGYKVGKIDGIYGKKTAAAIKSFQKDNNISVDGVVSYSLLYHLDKVSSGGKGGQIATYGSADLEAAKNQDVKNAAMTGAAVGTAIGGMAASDNPAAGAAVGGLVGGMIGNQVGQGAAEQRDAYAQEYDSVNGRIAETARDIQKNEGLISSIKERVNDRESDIERLKKKADQGRSVNNQIGKILDNIREDFEKTKRSKRNLMAQLKVLQQDYDKIPPEMKIEKESLLEKKKELESQILVLNGVEANILDQEVDVRGFAQ